MAYKLDIFAVLSELAKGNMDYYASLDDELKKSISPFVLMKWGRGATTDQDYHVILLNEYVNPYMFSLGKEPDLLWKLLCVALAEPGCRFKYIGKKKKASTKPLSLNTVKEYYGYSDKHAISALKLLTLTDIIEYAREQGQDNAEITKIKKEWE